MSAYDEAHNEEEEESQWDVRPVIESIGEGAIVAFRKDRHLDGWMGGGTEISPGLRIWRKAGEAQSLEIMGK